MKINLKFYMHTIFAVVMIGIVIFIGLVSFWERKSVNIKFTDGSTDEYSSSFSFEKGDSVLVYGPELRKNIIPNKKEFFMETTIPSKFFPIEKDTTLIFRYSSLDSVFQDVRIGLVDSIIEKNVFQ